MLRKYSLVPGGYRGQSEKNSRVGFWNLYFVSLEKVALKEGFVNSKGHLAPTRAFRFIKVGGRLGRTNLPCKSLSLLPPHKNTIQLKEQLLGTLFSEKDWKCRQPQSR